MKRILRVIFGFRDDIDLNQRWWHRLSKVLFLLFVMLPLIGFVPFLHRDSYPPELIPANLNLTKLTDFMKQPHEDVPNVTTAFLALPGQLGHYKDGRIEHIDYDARLEWLCWASDTEANMAPVRRGLNFRAPHCHAQ